MTNVTSSSVPSDGSRRSAGTALWVLIVVMAAVIIPLIGLSQVIAWYRTDVVDDQMFGFFGWRIAHGATVYLDVWDNKPPGIYWINALGMLIGGGSYLGVIALCALALAVAHAAFFIVASSVYHRSAAALTTILLAFYVTHAYYTGGTNRTETFLIAFELVGVAFYMRGFADDRWWQWYLAGTFCGIAFLFKQVGLAGWGCMGLHLIALMASRELSVRKGLSRGVLLTVGAATTIALAAGVLAARGALGAALFAVFEFNRAYFDVGETEFPYNFANYKLLERHVQPILLVPILMAVTSVIHGFLWWLRPLYRPPEIEQPLRQQRPVCPKALLFFGLWTLVAAYGATLSPHAFRHYLVPAIPPLMLMAGYLINVLRAETKLLQRIQQRAWVAVAFVILAYFAWGALVSQWREMSKLWVFRFEQGRRAEWEVVGAAVAELTRPEHEIQCFGYMPGVYLHARRVNACRFATTEKVGQVKGGARFVVEEMEHVLRKDPPALIVISSGDYFWMHGLVRDALPSAFQLGHWIDEHYQLVREIPGYGTIFIFKRRDLAEAAGNRDLTDYLEQVKTSKRQALAPTPEP